MPWNGSGTFNRKHNWTQEAATGIPILPTNMDDDTSDITSAGLGNCITRDGQGTPTANISWNNFKLTSLANPTLPQDAVPLLFMQNAITTATFNTALPLQAGNAGKFVTTDGTNASWTDTFTIPITYTSRINEAKGADIASAATVNLSTATGNLVHITGTTNITAFTIPSGAVREIVFDGILTLTNSATLILPTGANITTAVGDTATIRGDGAAARITKYQRADGKPLALTPIGDHEVVVHTGNGFGSTNTRIRRYTTVLKNVGTAITYADSATLGSSFTINENGFYAITNIAQGGGTASPTTVGISINSAQLTTDIDAVGFTASNRVGSSYAIVIGSITRTLKLSAGDVIRSHYGTTANAVDTFSTTMMSIAKVNTP